MKLIIWRLRAVAAALAVAAVSTLAQAQLFGSFGFGANVFDTKGLNSDQIPSQSCTGFYKTPNFRCESIKVPAYFARVKEGDRRALVVILPGAGGLDKRHSDYANFLASNGINALVLDPWRARGMQHGSGDPTVDRNKGGDDINFAIDGMAVQAQLRLGDEWKSTKFGFLGESRGGTSAMIVLRPFIESIVRDYVGIPAGAKVNFDASVGLYPACVDRNAMEGFKRTPTLIVSGGADAAAPPEVCERQVEWMNKRGGNATFKVLPDEYHDWDAPTKAVMTDYVSSGKCENMFQGDKIVLLQTQKEFPTTPEGIKAMNAECRTRGYMMGHRANPQTGYDVWLDFFKQKLLSQG
jgi:dienelactone hydrolase